MLQLSRLMVFWKQRVGWGLTADGNNCRSQTIGLMRPLKSFIPLLCATVLAGCLETKTTTYEPQSQSLDSRQARLHFIRHPSVLSRIGAPDIKVDDNLVGELGVGTYFFVDRPAGTHKITVYGAMDSVGCQADIRVEPGMSYYFEMGPIVHTNMDTFNLASMGITGRPIPCVKSGNSPYMFYSLDSTAGAATIAKLKERNS
jgi:hypothetical protein